MIWGKTSKGLGYNGRLWYSYGAVRFFKRKKMKRIFIHRVADSHTLFSNCKRRIWFLIILVYIYIYHFIFLKDFISNSSVIFIHPAAAAFIFSFWKGNKSATIFPPSFKLKSLSLQNSLNNLRKKTHTLGFGYSNYRIITFGGGWGG